MAQTSHDITFSKGFSYALIACAMAALTLPVYILVPQVYADTLGLGLGAVGVVLLLARLVDMATDPIAGWLSDRIPILGRHRRPWIFIGLGVMSLGAWALLVPVRSMVSPLYLGAASIILYIGWTLISIPLYALGTELGANEGARTRLMAWRESMILFGTVLTLIILGVFATDPLRAMFWVAIFVLCVGSVGFGLLYRLPEPDMHQKTVRDKGLGIYLRVFENKDFRRLLSAYVINGLANGLPATTFLLFVQHALETPEHQGVFLLIYFLSGLLVAPLWVKLARKIGRPALVWSWAMIWACSIFALVGFVDAGDIWLYGVICVGAGLSLGADMILPASLQAEVVALDRDQTGERRGGVFFAWWGMATKLALALAVGAAFPFLESMGCRSEACETTWPLKLVYGWLPIVLKIGAIALMWSFLPQKAKSSNAAE